MAKLRDVRRRFPPDDADLYASAYAQAELAGEIGALVHELRVAAHLSAAELGARLGVDEDQVLFAEEGDPRLTVAFLDGVARAVGLRLCISVSADAPGATRKGPGHTPAPHPDT